MRQQGGAEEGTAAPRTSTRWGCSPGRPHPSIPVPREPPDEPLLTWPPQRLRPTLPRKHFPRLFNIKNNTFPSSRFLVICFPKPSERAFPSPVRELSFFSFHPPQPAKLFCLRAFKRRKRGRVPQTLLYLFISASPAGIYGAAAAEGSCLRGVFFAARYNESLMGFVASPPARPRQNQGEIK